MKRCAFLTMDSLAGYVCYDHEAEVQLKKLGWNIDWIPWKNPTDWRSFDLVLVRSCWDYQQEPDAFLAVLNTIEGEGVRLENPQSLIRWNLEKTYLRDLAQQGIPTIPTEYVASLDSLQLEKSFERWQGETLIVKPVIGAGAQHTYKINRIDFHQKALAFESFQTKAAMIQPFLKNVVTEGEYSLFFFSGNYSHSILKTPKPLDFRVQEEYGSLIQSVEPSQTLKQQAFEILLALPQMPLYGRVDLIRDEENRFLLIELELIEPSLYFPYHPGSAQKFAQAIDAIKS